MPQLLEHDDRYKYLEPCSNLTVILASAAHICATSFKNRMLKYWDNKLDYTTSLKTNSSKHISANKIQLFHFKIKANY